MIIIEIEKKDNEANDEKPSREEEKCLKFLRQSNNINCVVWYNF